MRIAQIATVGTLVAPNGDSIEALVWLLTEELIRLGHEVTVFAAEGSRTSGELVTTLPGTYAQKGAPYDWQICEWINMCAAIEQSGRFDVIHSHAYLWGLPLDRLSRAPMVHTLHIQPDDDTVCLRRLYPGACVTAISRFQWSTYAELPPVPVIYHGIDERQFTFQPNPSDYLCYLGRFTEGKQPGTAIDIARELGMRLILAGPWTRYYEERIAPRVDGLTVQYIGPVFGEARDQLLGGAKALLYPIQNPEPFGLVVAEAMMCGTPVAAIGIGAVPELVDAGVTGEVAQLPQELPNAVRAASALDRQLVRARAQDRFSSLRMAREYEALYRSLATRPRRALDVREMPFTK